VLLADIETGDILYARNEHERIHPASTTKIMTALLAVEALERGEVSIGDLLVTTEAALADMVPLGSSLELEVDEEMSFEALLYAVMLISANDASNVIAERIGGSIENFIQMMNQRAQELGAHNTNFSNTHGLTADNHYSTAYDLFRITQHAITLPRFVELYAEQERAFAATNMRPAGLLRSTNFMTDSSSPYFYLHAHGVKTGFTSAAGLCLISTAFLNDIHLLAVVMGVPADEEEVNHFTESAIIYDWAFENFAHREILSSSTVIVEVPVEFGDNADFVTLFPAESIISLVQEGVGLDRFQREVTIFHEETGETLQAPIAQGQVLGEVTYTDGTRTFGPIPLVAGQAVHLSRVAYMRYDVAGVLESLWVRLIIGLLILLIALYIVFAIRHTIKKRKRKKERMGRRR